MWLKNQQVNEEIKEEIRKYLETNENEDTTFQNQWGVAKAVLRGIFIATSRNKKNLKQPNQPSKGIRRRRTKKAQTQQKEGNNKDHREDK